MPVRCVTSIADFDAATKSDATGVVVVVMFSAAWCAPCRRMRPVLANLAEAHAAAAAAWVYVDIDHAHELAAREAVTALPLFVVFRDGERIAQVVGAHEDALAACVEAAVCT